MGSYRVLWGFYRDTGLYRDYMSSCEDKSIYIYVWVTPSTADMFDAVAV